MKWFWLFAAVLYGYVCWAQTSAFPSKPQQSSQRNTPASAASGPRGAVPKLSITVTDENGVAVPSARVELQPPPPALVLRCETDFAGHCEFSNVSSGAYAIHAEKIGFYAISENDVQVGGTASLDVTLTRQQEAREVVNVAASSPAIDPAQISSKEELTAAEIINVPYPGAHDYRNGLIFIPGVTPDAYGLPHVAGAESYQTLLLLDGFK